MKLLEDGHIANIKSWIDALVSGQYIQTQYTLARKLPDGSYGFCCLGVACILAGLGVREAVARGNSFPNLLKDFGMSRHFEEIIGDSDQDCLILSKMNDMENATFEEIALVLFDYINLAREIGDEL